MKYGEIITLGRHKLMCGDAMNKDDVTRLIDGYKIDLVLTDPPYGMKCQDKHGAIGNKRLHKMGKRVRDKRFQNLCFKSNRYSALIGDDSQNTAQKHYEIIKTFTNKQIFWGGQYFAHFLLISGGWIFWDKLTSNNNFSDGELAWASFGKRVRKYECMWNGIIREGNRLYETKSRIHPTQKPVKLHMRILDDFSKPDNVILDCFGGSGTTLIACELTGRKCLMMEISPEYCDVIAKRYYDLMEHFPLFKELRTNDTG